MRQTDALARDVEAPRRPAARALPSLRALMLALVALELIVLYYPTARWLVGRWTTSVWHNAHGMFVPFVAGYLGAIEVKKFRGDAPVGSAVGFLFLIPALVLHAIDTRLQTQLLSAISIVVALPGLALLFLGTGRTKAIAFPLLFTGFMLPLPLALTEPVHLVLRQVTTRATELLLGATGLPIYSEGTLLQVPGASLLVSDACSGFSTLYAAVAVAWLVAFSTRGSIRRVGILLVAAPIAIASNIIRVCLLVLAVWWTGIEVLDTWVHPFSGMLTFALALPAILYLGRSSAATPALT